MFQKMSRQTVCPECPPQGRSKKKKIRCRACQTFVDVSISLNAGDIAYIRNAVSRGYKTLRTVSGPVFIANQDRYVNSKRGEATATLLEWRKSTNHDSVPVGCARYLLEQEDTANRLEVFDFAKKLRDRHRPFCQDTCVDLIHSGDQVNDDLITSHAMCPLDYSSLSRLATSASTTTSDDEPMASITQPIHTIVDQTEPMEIDSDEGLVPPRLSNSAIPLEVCKMLVRSDIKTDFNFNRVLQHWATKRRIEHEAVTELCVLCHAYQVQIEYTGPNKLPLCAKTLLKIDKEEVESACPRRKIKPAKDAKIPPTIRASPLAKKALIGEYMHFGLEKAILGASPGLVHRWEYLATLRRIHAVFPDLLPREFVELTLPQIGEEFHQDRLINWMFADLSIKSKRDSNDEVSLTKNI